MQILRQLLQQRPVWPAAALHEAVAAAGGGSSSSGRYPVDDLLPKLCYKFRNGALGCTGLRCWSCCLWRDLRWCLARPHAAASPTPQTPPHSPTDFPSAPSFTPHHPPTHPPPAGPWKNAWTQRGYDPRASPAARQWQCVEYHLPSEW